MAGWLGFAGVAAPPGGHVWTRIGRSMFFTRTSPPSLKAASTRFATLSATTPATQSPPGSASCSSRAATFTPSP